MSELEIIEEKIKIRGEVFTKSDLEEIGSFIQSNESHFLLDYQDVTKIRKCKALQKALALNLFNVSGVGKPITVTTALQSAVVRYRQIPKKTAPIKKKKVTKKTAKTKKKVLEVK